MVQGRGGAVIIVFELLLLKQCFVESHYSVAAEVDCVECPIEVDCDADC